VPVRLAIRIGAVPSSPGCISTEVEVPERHGKIRQSGY